MELSTYLLGMINVFFCEITGPFPILGSFTFNIDMHFYFTVKLVSLQWIWPSCLAANQVSFGKISILINTSIFTIYP